MSATDQVDRGLITLLGLHFGLLQFWFLNLATKHRNLRVRALDCVTAILSMNELWRDVFPSRAVRELGGLPARQGGTKAKLTTLPNQNSGFLLAFTRARARARSRLFSTA